MPGRYMGNQQDAARGLMNGQVSQQMQRGPAQMAMGMQQPQEAMVAANPMTPPDMAFQVIYQMMYDPRKRAMLDASMRQLLAQSGYAMREPAPPGGSGRPPGGMYR